MRSIYILTITRIVLQLLASLQVGHFFTPFRRDRPPLPQLFHALRRTRVLAPCGLMPNSNTLESWFAPRQACHSIGSEDQDKTSLD